MTAQHPVSRWGLGLGILVGLVIWPAVTLTAVWKSGLLGGNPPGSAWAILAFVVFILPALGFGAFRDLRSAWRTRIDDEGIGQGSARIRWPEITSLKLEEGIAVLTGAERRIRVATYLFEDHDALERTLLEHAREAGVEPETAR